MKAFYSKDGILFIIVKTSKDVEFTAPTDFTEVSRKDFYKLKWAYFKSMLALKKEKMAAKFAAMKDAMKD